MLTNVFTKTLRDMVMPLVWWASGFFILSLWVMTLVPSGQSSALLDYLNSMPDYIKAMTGGILDMSTWQGALGGEMFGLAAPGMMLCFGIAYGSAFIGGEEDGGTLDLLLSNPIPRWRVVLEKFAALVVFTVVVLAVSFVGYWLGAAIVKLDVDAVRLLEGTFNLLPITLFFSALTVCLTALKRGRNLAIGVSATLATLTYFSWGMAYTTDVPDWIQKLSPWTYYDGAKVLFDGLKWGNVGLLLGLTVLLVAAAAWGFGQRDLGT